MASRSGLNARVMMSIQSLDERFRQTAAGNELLARDFMSLAMARGIDAAAELSDADLEIVAADKNATGADNQRTLPRLAG